MSESKHSNNYKIVKLKSLVVYHNAGVYKKSDLYGTGTNIVGVSDLYRHNSINGQEFRRVPLTNEELSQFTLQEGDLIYGESSLVLDGIAKTLYVTKRGAGTAFAWHTRRFKVNQNHVDAAFLNKALQSENSRKQIMAVATQTALTGITTKDFFNTEVPLPTLSVQRKIARILSTMDAVIEKTEAVIAKYKAIKAGMMRDLFTRGINVATGKLRPSNEEAPELYQESKLGMIPKEWALKALRDCCELITDGSHFSPSSLADGEIIVNVKDMGKYGINYETCKRISKEEFSTLKSQNCSPKRGDVLLSKDGTIGRVILYNDIRDIVLLSSIAILRPKNRLKSNFLYIFLKSEYFERQLINNSSGSALKRIVLKDINKLLICYPIDIEEQNLASQKIIQVENNLKIEETYLHKMQHLKQALMSDLLTGKVRVKYEEEKAEVA